MGTSCVVRGATICAVSSGEDGSREGRETSAGLPQLQQTGKSECGIFTISNILIHTHIKVFCDEKGVHTLCFNKSYMSLDTI